MIQNKRTLEIESPEISPVASEDMVRNGLKNQVIESWLEDIFEFGDATNSSLTYLLVTQRHRKRLLFALGF
jgi:hypothetical protein